MQGIYLPCHVGLLIKCSFYSLFIPENEVKYKAYHCKGNACSSQDGEDDSEGKIYWHLLLYRDTIMRSYTSWKVETIGIVVQ